MNRAPLNYLASIAADSARFAEVLRATDRRARVPTCPEWYADDLLWHLAEVQWFWSRIVRHRPSPFRDLSEPRPSRPAERAALLALGEQATRDLLTELSAAEPEQPAWSWSSEQTVGFIYRRQAQEALIHRLDAELTAGSRTALDAHLAADGVDEILRVMFGGAPSDASLTVDPAATIRLTAADTGDQWLVTPARARGVRNAQPYDLPTLVVAETDAGSPAAAAVTGTAEDLDCWLWNRPPRRELSRTGDLEVLRGLDAIRHVGVH